MSDTRENLEKKIPHQIQNTDIKGVKSWFAYLEKFSLNFSSLSFEIHLKSMSIFFILVPIWFIIFSLVFLSLYSKLLFSGFF